MLKRMTSPVNSAVVFGFAALTLVSPAQGQVAPAHDQVSPAQGQVAPAQDQVSPAQGQVSPAQGQVAPAQGQVAPVQGQVAPAQDHVSPVQSQVAPAQGQVAPAGPPIQTAGAEPMAHVGAYLRLPATYTLLRGAEFDGRHAGALDGNRTIYLPKLSGGFGFKPSLGVKVDHLAPHFGIMAGLGFGFSKHQAISYNVGNSWYEHPYASFYQLELEMRALAEFGNWKPFISLSPGYAMLSLPRGVTVLDASRNVSWSDVTLRGASMEIALGLLCEVISPLALDASLGYRLQKLTSSGDGSLSGFGFSPGWSASLGVVLAWP